VGEISVQFSLIFTQIGFSTAYVIFTGQNLSDMFPIFSSFVWTWIVAPLFVLICLIRRFKWLAPFRYLLRTCLNNNQSLVGYIAIMFGLGVVMEYCFKDQLLNGQTQITWDRVNHMDYKTLPIFFGIAVYIFEGIGLVIDMEKAMTKPEYFQVGVFF
jgi:proton-coupled amino acid transporter